MDTASSLPAWMYFILGVIGALIMPDDILWGLVLVIIIVAVILKK